MDIVKQLLLQLILILLNALFAATELAMVSINEKKVRAQAEDGDKKAAKLLRVIEDPNKFLSAIQVGITLAGFLGSAFAADSFAERLTNAIVRAFDTPPSAKAIQAIDTVSVVIITLILDFRLALIMIAVLPLIGGSVFLIARRGLPLYRKTQIAVDGMVRVVREDCQGVRVMKALSREEYEKGRCDRANRARVENERRAGVGMAASQPTRSLL